MVLVTQKTFDPEQYATKNMIIEKKTKTEELARRIEGQENTHTTCVLLEPD